MECLLSRTLDGFEGADAAGEKFLRRVRPGDIIRVNATIPRDQRSVKQHRLYFKVIKTIFDHLPERFALEIPTAEHLRMRIFYAIGFTEVIKTGAGDREVPRSIAFAKLGQEAFYQEVWRPTLELCDKTLVPGIGPELEQEYRALVG
jgi:hypothetical protein